MELKELKKIIENPKYPKKDFIAPFYLAYKDSFRIKSIMYSQDIYLNSLSSIDELHKKIKDYGLSSELFNQPFYLIVSLQDFNDKTLDILNSLDKDIVIQIVAEISKDIGPKEMDFLLKINCDNIYLYNNEWVSQENMKFILSKFKVDSDDTPVLVINKIDSNTAGFIRECAKKYPRLRLKIEIKDMDSLINLNSIMSSIPENEIMIFLDNNLFSSKNSNNIRNLILQRDFSIKLNVQEGKKIEINYNGLEYKSMEDVFKLERYLEIVKSHIPSKASELDIVSYVSLFEANYFTYDYEEYERSGKYANNEIKRDELSIMNLMEFITSRKGVCRDYAAFTKFFLTSLNVDCEVVETGSEFYYDHSINEGHAFNLVRIKGKEYFLDNTWLAETLQTGQIHTLAESPNFLTSNDEFQHAEYKSVLEYYHCETMDRGEILQSTIRVLNWNKNYFIHPQAIADLFRKHVMKNNQSIERQIEDAIPKGRGLK